MPDLLLQATATLPVLLDSIDAVVLGPYLHVVGIDDHRAARHLAVDRAGQVVAPPTTLPLVQVSGIAAASDSIVVCGVAANDSAQVVRIDRDGGVQQISEIRFDGRFQSWPRPVAAAGGTWIVATTSGERRALHLQPIGIEGPATPLAFGLRQDTDGIGIGGDASGLTVALVYGGSAGLELFRIEAGRLTARAGVDAVRPTAPAVASHSGRIAVAWVSEPGEPHLAWFDNRLGPLQWPDGLPATSIASVRRIQLLGNGAGSGAFVVHSRAVVGDAAIVHAPDGTRISQPPRREFPLHVAAHDPDAHISGPLRLVETHVHAYAAVWFESTFVVLHRGSDTRLTTYTEIR